MPHFWVESHQRKMVSQVSYAMKAIYNEGLVGVCEEGSSGETHCFFSLMQLLYDGIRLN